MDEKRNPQFALGARRNRAIGAAGKQAGGQKQLDCLCQWSYILCRDPSANLICTGVSTGSGRAKRNTALVGTGE